jgi:DNA-binding transcriptional MerR regulator
MDMTDQQNRFTIGQLAHKVGLRTSAIRYYEQEKLLVPAERGESGYRLYPPETEQDLRFIQRAQRLGFSLADIRVLIKGWRSENLDEEAFLQTAEVRYLALERQATEVLILQHELGLFLQDIYNSVSTTHDLTPRIMDLLEHICNHPLGVSPALIIDNLLERSGCRLNTSEAKIILNELRGQHTHIWQEEDGYSVLIVSDDPLVGNKLEKLAEMAFDCQAHEHSHQVPELMHNSEGYLLHVRGQNAFLIARLFLTLETH